MKILITGAGGFIGQFLARELASSGSHQLILTDIIEVPAPHSSAGKADSSSSSSSSSSNNNVSIFEKVDLGDESVRNNGKIITPDLDAIYLFHGIMSAGAEADFDLGLRVNVDVTRAVLEDIRRTCRPGIRVIYSSSLAVYGPPFPALDAEAKAKGQSHGAITENIFPTPEGSYGAQKLMVEILINDMTRKGYITGFNIRFPTVSVRPGRPSAAASSFISGIIREPLAGKECVVPVKDRAFPSWVCSPKTLIWNLVHLLSLPREALPLHKRAINAPGHRVTVQDMLDALDKVGRERDGSKDKESSPVKYVKEEHVPELAKILYSWAVDYDISLALGLGFKADTSFEQAVREYVQFVDGQANQSQSQ